MGRDAGDGRKRRPRPLASARCELQPQPVPQRRSEQLAAEPGECARWRHDRARHPSDRYVRRAGRCAGARERAHRDPDVHAARAGFCGGRDRFRGRDPRASHLPVFGSILRPLHRHRRPRLGGGAGGRKCRQGPAVDACLCRCRRREEDKDASIRSIRCRRISKPGPTRSKAAAHTASRRNNFSPMFACWKRSCAQRIGTAPRSRLHRHPGTACRTSRKRRRWGRSSLRPA